MKIKRSNFLRGGGQQTGCSRPGLSSKQDAVCPKSENTGALQLQSTIHFSFNGPTPPQFRFAGSNGFVHHSFLVVYKIALRY